MNDKWHADMKAWEKKVKANRHHFDDNELLTFLHKKFCETISVDDASAVAKLEYLISRQVLHCLLHKEYNLDQPQHLEQGKSDEELTLLIGEAFGTCGGQSFDNHYFQDEWGGTNPRCRVQDSSKHPDWRTVKLLKGAELVSVIRKHLGISNPVPVGQAVMF